MIAKIIKIKQTISPKGRYADMEKGYAQECLFKTKRNHI